ncbi:major mannose-resistant fimbrial protein [Xenorhabdus beddingii]|uniref:Major mannose-resistant fimbrial protein n=1 Tax=Xenorhabdus beddingii TaxID=40578 RepID=A0A1Y2SQX7_9GAMM|nr:fimbrial protein [Xenorhabdus beddingii]OTA20214.1 major mannose-resistant fimbrial protein [Xenorhabdus beddingii]
MRLHKMAAIVAMTMGMVTFTAQAESTTPAMKLGEEGTINFRGSVIESPCNISSDALYQTIDFGSISKSFLDEGKTKPMNFSIQLEQCDTKTASQAHIMFSGQDADNNELIMIGNAKGIAVELADHNGKITLGQKKKVMNITAGKNTLNFVARAKKSAGYDKEVSVGDFNGTANFTVYYQ